MVLINRHRAKIKKTMKFWTNLFKKPRAIKPKKPVSSLRYELNEAYLTELITELEFQIYWQKQLRQIPAWIWNSPDNFFEPKEPKQLPNHA